MTIRNSLLVSALAVAVWAGPAAAEIPKSEAEELLAATGVEAQVRSIPESIKKNLERQQEGKQSLSASDIEKAKSILDRAASPDELVDWVVAGVARKLDRRHLEPLLSWSRSDLGARITDRERQLADPETARAIVRKADKLLADDEARNRAERVAELGLGMEHSMMVFKKTQLALAVALIEARRPEGSVTLKTLEKRIDSRAGQFRDRLRRATLAGFAHAYGPLSEDEFNRYVEFLATDAAQHYAEVLGEVQRAVLTRYTERVAEQSGVVKVQ